MEYESHEKRCANHDLSYNIEYESHKEICTNDVEYESKRTTEEESGKGKICIYCQYVSRGQ